MSPGTLLRSIWTHYKYDSPSLTELDHGPTISKNECVIFLGETSYDKYDVFVRCLTSAGVGWCLMETFETA